MSLQPNFNIENLNIMALQDAEVNIEQYFNCGRCFKVYLNGIKSITYTLTELVNRVKDITYKEITNDPTELKVLRDFIIKLKKADTIANYAEQSKNLDDLITEIQKKAFKRNSTDDYQKPIKKTKREVISKEVLIHLTDTSKLIFAITSGNIKHVKQLLANEEIDVNKADENKSTLLMTATLFGKIEIVKLLLKQNNIDVNLQDEYGATPLMLASINGETEIVKLLLQHKEIDVNIQDKLGLTTLMSLIHHGNTLILKLLLDHKKIDLNCQDLQGSTALMYATRTGRTEIAKLLLQQEKIDINIQDKKGATPLLTAVSIDKPKIVKLLIEHHKTDVNQLDIYRRTAFVRAALAGKYAMVKMMKTCLKPNDLLVQKEMLKLITLAHSTDLAGTSQIHLTNEDKVSNSIKLEGLTSFYAYKKINIATKIFSENHSNFMKKNAIDHLQELIGSGLLNSHTHIMARIENGLPAFLSAGFDIHAVTILVWGPYFLICNRGGESRRCVEIYQYNPQKLNSEILDKIEKTTHKDKSYYNKLFFKKIQSLLEFKPQDEFEKTFEKLCKKALDKQKVGNCAWASPEAGVFAFLALFKLLSSKSGQLIKTPTSGIITEQQFNEIQENFFTWQSFIQIYTLENYLGVHHLRSNDTSEKMEKSAHRRKSIAIDYSVTISAIKTIKRIAERNNKTLLPVQHILARTISIITGETESTDKNFQTAKKILDAIDTIKPEEMKAKIEQSS